LIRRALLIANPAARIAAGASAEAVGAFQLAGVHCDSRLTDRPGHAAELARTHAAEYDAVFTLGGDGTAVEVIGALADKGPPVGILPGGTGNLLARALRIPLQISDAVAALVNGHETRRDLGRLGDGRHFAIGVGVGVDADMIAGASHEMKQRLGWFAYMISGVSAGLQLKQFRYRVIVDGVPHEGEATSVLIANFGSLLGGVVRLGKHVRDDDGILDVCIFQPRSAFAATRAFARMLVGDVALDPAVKYFAGKQIRIETTPPRRGQSDGELLGLSPLDITVRPGAARLLVPGALTG
jgi:diacylglycerol kinase (ATP)